MCASINSSKLSSPRLLFFKILFLNDIYMCVCLHVGMYTQELGQRWPHATHTGNQTLVLCRAPHTLNHWPSRCPSSLFFFKFNSFSDILTYIHNTDHSDPHQPTASPQPSTSLSPTRSWLLPLFCDPPRLAGAICVSMSLELPLESTGSAVGTRLKREISSTKIYTDQQFSWGR